MFIFSLEIKLSEEHLGCHCQLPGNLLSFPSSGLFWRIWHMDLVQSAVLYCAMTLVSTYLVAFAYKNVKFVLKHK